MLLQVGVLFGAAYAYPNYGRGKRRAFFPRSLPDWSVPQPSIVARFGRVRGDSPTLGTAQGEFIRGVRGMLGKTVRAGKELPREKAIVFWVRSHRFRPWRLHFTRAVPWAKKTFG